MKHSPQGHAESSLLLVSWAAAQEAQEEAARRSFEKAQSARQLAARIEAA